MPSQVCIYYFGQKIQKLHLLQGPRYSMEQHLEENCQQHLSMMCNVVTKQQHQISSLRSALARLSLNYSGTLIWKISDFAAKMTEAKTKEGMELVSPPFYTSQYGYKLQVFIIFEFRLVITLQRYLTFRRRCFRTATVPVKTLTYLFILRFCPENTMLSCVGLLRIRYPSRCSTSRLVRRRLATLSRVSFPTRHGRTSKGPVKSRTRWVSVFLGLSLMKC